MAKILYAKRNVLSATEGLIVHACNTEGTMGSGVAPRIAEKYPKALQVYVEQHNRAIAASSKETDPYHYQKILLGRCTFAECGDLFIANMVTQTLNDKFNGKPTSLDAIEQALATVNRNYPVVCKKLGKDTVPVNMPIICAVRGGVPWPITAAIIEHTLKDIPEVIVNILDKEWDSFHKQGWVPKDPTYQG